MNSTARRAGFSIPSAGARRPPSAVMAMKNGKSAYEEAEGQLRRQTEDVVAHSLPRNLARNSPRVERFGALRRWIPTSPCPRSHQSMGQHGRSEPRETVTRYAVATVALGIRRKVAYLAGDP